MTEQLVLTADAAFPFDLTTLPKGVSVVLGYVGQLHCTPHIWTADEVAKVRTHGYQWAPIWVPPVGMFTRELAEQAMNGMSDALVGYDYPAAGPVFLDIEEHVYALAPETTVAACRTWEAGMVARGHSAAVAYLPGAANHGWRAKWDNVRPTMLPDYLQGWQYSGEDAGGRYDLSVFRPEVFTALTGGTTEGGTVAADVTQAWITAQLKQLQENVFQVLNGHYNNTWEGHQFTNSQTAIMGEVQAVLAKVDGLGSGAVDVAALAAELSKAIAPVIAADVLNGLAERLKA